MAPLPIEVWEHSRHGWNLTLNFRLHPFPPAELESASTAWKAMAQPIYQPRITLLLMSLERDLNPQPPGYEPGVLPIELSS